MKREFDIKLTHKETDEEQTITIDVDSDVLENVDECDLLVGTKGIVWDYVDINEWYASDVVEVTKEVKE